MLNRIILVGVLAMASIGFGASRPTSVPVYSYKVVNTYPHDPNAFTQGLVYRDGVLYESTGLRGRQRHLLSLLVAVKLGHGLELLAQQLFKTCFPTGDMFIERLQSISRATPYLQHHPFDAL